MKEWDNCIIDDLGTVVGGSTPRTSISEYWDGNIPWITPRDMSQQTGKKYILKGERFITEKGLKNSSARLLPKGTVLFTSRAPIGYIGIAAQAMVTNQGFKSIVVNETNSNEFVYYLLKHSVDKIIGMAGGSTFKEINATTFKEIEVKIPPLPTQRRIAGILSALDDKIENNRRICETLEQIAQVIFKRWFVEFDFPDAQGRPYKSSGGRMVESELGLIPEGWRKEPLKNYISFIKGKKPKEFCDKKHKEAKQYLTIDALGGGIPIYTNLDKMVKCIKDDILMVMDGASSGVVYYGYDGIVASTLAKIETRNDMYEEIIYQLLTYYQNDIKSHTTGSAVPHADKGYILNFLIPIPSDHILTQIANLFSKIRKSIINLKEINNSLQQTRDILLPKLMSGEVEV